MSRLYFRVYLHFVAIIVVFGAVVALGWLVHDLDDGHRHDDGRRYDDGHWDRFDADDGHQDRFEADGGHRDRFGAMARLIARSLPEDEAALPDALGRIADDFRVRLALYRADRVLIASAGTPAPPPPEPGRETGGWQRAAGGPVLLFRLPDGRWLSAHVPRRPRGRWLGLLATLAVVIAVGAWPLARRITRRLERLQTRVDALGAGDLGARVEVEGSDEIAALARSFNRAAERIESLVAVQRTMLASASHELRSPLARMRMAIELYGDAPRPELRERIERDVAELDGLIDELLLASRLQMVQDLEALVPVDLLALTAEEGARVDAIVTGGSMEGPAGEPAGDSTGAGIPSASPPRSGTTGDPAGDSIGAGIPSASSPKSGTAGDPTGDSTGAGIPSASPPQSGLAGEPAGDSTGERAGGAIVIDGDHRLLRHLLRNLFENARRHGAGTEIGASVARDEAGVLLRVRDRGPGIPESERERIFDPFYRPAAMREEGSGVGLGLHLVKVIAERHGASVGYRPNEPGGSCFEVRFPPGTGAPQSFTKSPRG